MAITTSGTTLTFNDATTQTTAGLVSGGALGTPSSGALTNCTSVPVNQATGTLPVANGGSGQTTYTNGQLLIGNTTGNTLTKATLTAGTGISITNGAGSISIAATGGGTVTSVATGNGLSGGTITTSGTLTLGAVGANTVGSYAFCGRWGNAYGPASVAFNSNYAGGAGNMQTNLLADYGSGLVPGSYQSDLSGTWKWLSADAAGSNFNTFGIAVRVA
jgi:hypothetical protein